VNSAARVVLFGLAALVGVASAYFLSGRPASDALLPLSHPHLQDWFMWIVGLWLVAYCLYRLFRGAANLDLRWSICLILGSTLIYAEWFDVAPLKEVACRVLHARQHPAPPAPCYKPADPDGG
jgi:hypothetical protein